jgi:glycosyltransferase 2 family protein
MESSLTSATVLESEKDLARPMQSAAKSEERPGILSRISGLSKATQLRIKVIFSLLLFGSLFVFGKIDLSKTIQVAAQANLWFLSAAAALFLGSTLINAYRWKLLAQAVGFHKPVLEMLQFCFVGMFFNLFLPSTVGGDVSRCYYLSKGTGKYKQAFYSVFADRAVGIAVLFIFASLGILLGPGGGGLPWHLKLPIFLGTLGVLVVVPLAPAISRRVLGEHHRITQRFNNSTAQIYWHDRKLILAALLQSLLLQIIIVICHVLIGWSLGLTVPLWYYFVFYPSVAVLGFITPSFNGIGVREGAYTYFLMLPVAGVDKAHAFTYALIWLGMNTGISLVGGLVYLAGHFKFSQEEAEKLRDEADEDEELPKPQS